MNVVIRQDVRSVLLDMSFLVIILAQSALKLPTLPRTHAKVTVLKERVCLKISFRLFRGL